MLPRWPCCWSSRSRPTTSSLQSGRAVWIPVCRLHSDVTVSRAMELLWLTQRVQSQRDFKDSIIKTVCSVSSYKANCKEYTDKVIMDEGFSLPCYGTFHRKLWWSRQGKDLSLLCPLFQMGCCWICKCMVNRNSMMQNITYNPFGQDPFLPFFFFFWLPQLPPQLLVLILQVSFASVHKEIHLRSNSDFLKSRIVICQQPKMHFIFYLW